MKLGFFFIEIFPTQMKTLFYVTSLISVPVTLQDHSIEDFLSFSSAVDPPISQVTAPPHMPVSAPVVIPRVPSPPIIVSSPVKVKHEPVSKPLISVPPLEKMVSDPSPGGMARFFINDDDSSNSSPKPSPKPAPPGATICKLALYI